MAKTIAIRDDFDPRFYDELGRVVVASGRVEYMLKLCIKSLLKKGFAAGFLEGEMEKRIPNLCAKMLEIAAGRLSVTAYRKLVALCDDIKTLANSRNDMIHALWTATHGGRSLRIRPKLTTVNGAKVVDWNKTEPVALSRLQRLTNDLQSCFDKLQAERISWP